LYYYSASSLKQQSTNILGSTQTPLPFQLRSAPYSPHCIQRENHVRKRIRKLSGVWVPLRHVILTLNQTNHSLCFYFLMLHASLWSNKTRFIVS